MEREIRGDNLGKREGGRRMEWVAEWVAEINNLRRERKK